MNETYVECLVAQQPKASKKFLKILLIVLTVIVGVFSILFLAGTSFGLIGFIIAVALGVAAYFVSLSVNIEYEYLYCDKEIKIDKILNKTKRKKVATYGVDKMEIFAPIKSYHLDEFKNRQAKELDYSSSVEKQPDHRYVLYYEGQQKLILEPSPEFVKAVYNVAPRKVFTD